MPRIRFNDHSIRNYRQERRTRHLGMRITNNRETTCSRCAAAMKPGDGVAVYLRKGWTPFCDTHDPAKIETSPPPVQVLPPRDAYLLGESTPGWRHGVERREEMAATHNPQATHDIAKAQQRRFQHVDFRKKRDDQA